MQKRRSDEQGFTLIEVIVTLILVGITAALAGMWIVSVANGYIFAKMNANTVQKGQLAMTRLAKEFSAIQYVYPTNTNGTQIKYDRVTGPSTPVVTVIVSRSGDQLLLGSNILTDNVNDFTLAYCDNPDFSTCFSPSSWLSTSKIIEITLKLTGANNIVSTFTQRIIPRNI